MIIATHRIVLWVGAWSWPPPPLEKALERWRPGDAAATSDATLLLAEKLLRPAAGR
jgi:hypothetical protein